MHRPLPGEILDEVFEYLSDDRKTLATCSRVSRHLWYPFASRRLFRSLRFQAVTAYAPGYTGHARIADYKDFLAFLKTCQRAAVYTTQLTLVGYISSGWRGPLSTGPTRVPTLGADVLADIVAVLPVLRVLELMSVAMSPPSLFFRQSARPPLVLDCLTFDYTATYHSALDPSHPMLFHLPSVLSLFQSVGEVRMSNAPAMQPHQLNVFTLPYSGARQPRIQSLAITRSSFQELRPYLTTLTDMLAPGYLSKLYISFNDVVFPADSHGLLDSFLRRVGTRIQEIDLQLLGHDTGRSGEWVTFANSVRRRADRFDIGITASAELAFPALARNAYLHTINLTQRLYAAGRETEQSQTAFLGLMSILLSSCPAKQGSLIAIPRRIHLWLAFDHNPRTIDDARSHRLILNFVKKLEWRRLDDVAHALGWGTPAAAEEVARTELPSGMCGIVLSLKRLESNRPILPEDDLPGDVRAHVGEIVRAQVSANTRRVLRIL